MTDSFQSINLHHDIPDLTKPFQITCAAKTDIWDKPPSTHSFNAPIIYQSTTVGAFKSAKVTISANLQHKYDQGGLCLVVQYPDGRQWVKTGIEFENDQVNVSTVAKDKWSDWSLMPLSNGVGATISLETSEKDGALWVYLIDDTGKRTPLREITWWNVVDKNAECWIGPYVAKPAPHGGNEDLTVDFKDLVISLS